MSTRLSIEKLCPFYAQALVVFALVAAVCLAATLIAGGSHAYCLGSRSRLHLQTALPKGLAMSRTISARIPDALYDQLQTTANSLGVSVSELLVRAIHSHLQTAVNIPYAPVNAPQTVVNCSAIEDHLATIEARLAALEMAVFTPVDIVQTAVNIPTAATTTGIPETVQTPVDSATTAGIPDLDRLSVAQLRKLAQGRGIPKYWVLGKAALLAELG